MNGKMGIRISRPVDYFAALGLGPEINKRVPGPMAQAITSRAFGAFLSPAKAGSGRGWGCVPGVARRNGAYPRLFYFTPSA